MRITALNRGGLAVYGGTYDPHTNEAIALVRDGESLEVTIEYGSAPTAPAASSSGITASAPAVSGQKVTTTLSSIQDGGYTKISATVGGATREVWIRARTRTQTDTYASGS